MAFASCGRPVSLPPALGRPLNYHQVLLRGWAQSDDLPGHAPTRENSSSPERSASRFPAMLGRDGVLVEADESHGDTGGWSGQILRPAEPLTGGGERRRPSSTLIQDATSALHSLNHPPERLLMDEAGNVALDRKELLAMHRGSSRHLKVEEYRCEIDGSMVFP